MTLAPESSERGQAYVVGATTAAILLLATVVLVQQSVLFTPFTSSTASQQVQNQQSEMAHGFLTTTAENGELKDAVLQWNTSNQSFYDTRPGESSYILEPPDNSWGNYMSDIFISNGIGINVTLFYFNSDGDQESQEYLNLGQPSDNAYSARETITIYDDDQLIDSDGNESGSTVKDEEDNMYLSDVSNTQIYNKVEVRVVIWQL